MFRLSDQQVYVPISAKLSSSALDWAQKHGRHASRIRFCGGGARRAVRASPWPQLRDTITVHLDEQRFQQVNHSNLVYQGGVVLSPGAYRMKFVARENESGKIGTFEQALAVPQRPAARMTLSSVLLSSQLVPIEKSSEVQTKGQGLAREARRVAARNGRRKNRAERDALFHAAADALRFLPGLLSGEAGQIGDVRCQHAARGPRIFPRTACR